MAGDWMKIRLDLFDDPAVIGISGQVGLDEFAVVGRLTSIWAWANRQTEDGLIPHASFSFVDQRVRCEGFAEAMQKVGWLDSDGGKIIIPKFDRHNGRSAKERALNTLRKQDQRVRRSRSSHARGATREEKRREESNTPPTPQGEVPRELDTKEFREAWAEWFAFRAELKKPLTHRMVKMQLKFLSALGGVSLAVQSIEQSIGAGWQGLFPPGRGGAHGAGNRGAGGGKAETPQERRERIRAETLARREESERLRAESVPAGELFRKLTSNNEGNRHEQAEEAD